MKTFVVKTALYAVSYILILSCFLLTFQKTEIVREYLSQSYYMGYLNTLKKVEGYKNSQKILFIGGSNLGFGLNTERIEKDLNIKSFNLGVQAGFGLKRPIQDVKNFLSPNDILIISPEYSNIEDPYRYDRDVYHLDFLEQGFSGVSDIESFAAYLHFVRRTIVGLVLDPDREKDYSLAWFNANGDVVGHYNLEPKPISNKFIGFSDLRGDRAKALIEEILHETTYYIIPPVTHEARFDLPQRNRINEAFVETFKQHYPLTIESMVFGADCFYNTAYHLNSVCSEERTKKILNFLKTVVD